jgi:hypothetical protein
MLALHNLKDTIEARRVDFYHSYRVSPQYPRPWIEACKLQSGQ